jgi:D-aminoacyl-tRNA deacylase
MIVVFTSKNAASANIAEKLAGGHGFSKADGGWERGGVRLICTTAPSVLEVPTDFDTDCLIVLSTHRSRVPGRMLTAHVPGNWAAAEMGGEPRALNIAPASALKTLLRELKREGDRIGWPVSLEADHHGPLSKAPILFVEIGNGEEQWADGESAAAVANAGSAAVSKHETFETVFAVGGGHYPRTFTRLVLESELAVGHICPKYAIESLAEDTFSQAIEKNVEKVSRVLIAKDETNAPQKEKIRKLCGDFGMECAMV